MVAPASARSSRQWMFGLGVLVALGVAVFAMFRETLRPQSDLAASMGRAAQGPDRRPDAPPADVGVARLLVGDAAGGDGVPLPLVQGVVLDPDGRAAAGATVSLFRMVTGWPEWQSELLDEAITREDGSFQFRNPARQGLLVGFEHKRFAGGLQPVSTHGEPLTLQLQGGFEVFGYVLGDSGTPVPNARVSVEAVPGEQRRVVTTVTAADGRYELRNLVAGPARLVARHASWQPTVAPAVVIGDQVRVDLRFDRPTMSLLRGHIVSAVTQEPIVGARVQIVPINQKLGLAETIDARTAADGSFLLEGLPRGSVRLLVRHPQHGAVMRTQVIGAVAQDLTIELPLRSIVEGQLLTERGDELIRGGEVVQLQDMAGEVQFATLDEAGRFRFERPVSPGWADLSFVDGEVAFRRSFCATMAVRIVEAATTQLELAVLPAPLVRGRFVDDQGQPLAGVRTLQTRLLSESARVIGDAAWQLNLADVGSQVAELFGAEADAMLAISDADGRFEIRGRLPGQLFARASHAGSGSRLLRIQVPSPGNRVDLGDIVLPRAATIVGRVMRGPARFVGATVVAVGSDCHELAVSDGSGSFAVRNLMPGTYTIRARIPGRTTGSNEQTITVGAGETSANVLLRLDVGRPVRGQVTGLDGQPLPGALVTVRGMPGQVAVTDQKGEFLVELPARPVELQVSLGDRSRLRNVPVDLTQTTVSVQIDAPPTCTVHAQVAGLPGRRRLQGALLRSWRLDEQGEDVRTRWIEMPGGELLWSQCPSGRVRIEIWCDGYAPFVGEYDFAANVEHRLDEVLLEPGTRLRGVVRDAEGQAVADASVLLGEETDLDLFDPQVRTGRDGAFVVQGVTGRSARLVVRAPGYAPRVLDLSLPHDVLSPEPLQVVLERGATIEVHVASDLVRDGGIVQLRRQGHVLASAELDERGRAWFANRSAGVYELRLFGHDLPDREVVVQPDAEVVRATFSPVDK